MHAAMLLEMSTRKHLRRARYLAVSAALVVVACSPVPVASQNHISQVQRNRTVAASTELLRCGALLKFSGLPRPFSPREFAKIAEDPRFRKPGTWEVDSLLHVTSTTNETATCMCRDS